MDLDIENLLDGLCDNEEIIPDSNEPEPLSKQISKLFAQLKADFSRGMPLDGLSVEEYLQVVHIMLSPRDLDEAALVKVIGRDRSMVLSIHLSTKTLPPLSNEAEVKSLAGQISELLEQIRREEAEIEAALPQKMPNLACLLDSSVAARLLAKCGGLQKLAVTPPANLVNPRTSVLADSSLIKPVPLAHKRAALRILAGKVVLAARTDLNSPELSASTVKWQQGIRDRIDKLLAPPPSLQQRSLPKPVDRRLNRRGGQKQRKKRQKAAVVPETVKFGSFEVGN